MEQGRWFRGKRVVSESPTAAPPAAAPPLAPETPAKDSDSQNDVEPPAVHEESSDGDNDTDIAAVSVEKTEPEVNVKEEEGSKVDGSMTPSTVDSYVVDDEETHEASRDSDEEGGGLPISSPPEEDTGVIADTNGKHVPASAVEI